LRQTVVSCMLLTDAMILNEELGYDDWARGNTRYDASQSFIGIPERKRLDPPTALYRLDYMARGQQFLEVWWMQESVFNSLIKTAQRDPARFRQMAEDGHALPALKSKPIGGGAGEEYERLSVTQIRLTQPVYALVGAASGLFGKPGGLDQVFLPNLHVRGSPRCSDHAVLCKTYWIRF
jgi:hypothetical protein